MLGVRLVHFALLGCGACLFAWITVASRWTTTDSAFLGVAGLIPVSDAMGYFRCALSISDSALPSAVGVPADWCGRRVLYPLSLLTLLSLAGYMSAFALLIQASIIGACLIVFTVVACNAVTRTTGSLAGVLCAVFAYQWATANFMTEFLGLSAGLISATLFLIHSIERRPAFAVFGVAMLSMALAARAGALFALPLVCIWCYFTMRPADRRIDLRTLLTITLAALFGPVLHSLGALSIGASLINSGGNFSASLYGLSTGSRDWHEAYRVFAHLFSSGPEGEVFRFIQARALENIQAEPGVFIKSLYGATSLYVVDLFGFVSIRGTNLILTALLIVGLLRCLQLRRNGAMSLTLIIFIGELLAAPFIIDSGGQRVFAATVWCRALLAGIGASTCLALAAQLFRFQVARKKLTAAFSTTAIATLVLGALLTALVAAPMTPLARLMGASLIEARHVCPAGQFAAVVDFRAETMVIGVSQHTRMPFSGPLLVAPGRFEADDSLRGSSWGGQLGPMLVDSWVASAFDRQRHSKGSLLSFFWSGQLPASDNGWYAICVGDVDELKQLGDFKLRRLESIEPFKGVN